MASSVSRFSVKPNASMRNAAPTSEIGIATTGMITERHDPRKRKITTTTIASVSVSVRMTSFSASWMYFVASYGTPTFIPAGTCRSISGSSARTALITSSEFAVGSTQMPMKVAFCPEKRTSMS